MIIQFELISKIISYIPREKCYRCNKKILPIDKKILYENNTFCSNSCTEYQHY